MSTTTKQNSPKPYPGSSSSQIIWFITGTSSGLGRALVLAALARGDRVIATARTLSKIKDLESHSEIGKKGMCYIMPLDVTADFAAIQQTALAAIAVWGRVDVVVNNAGIGILAPFEELGYEGALEQMKTNYFGPVNVTRAFLPHMRARCEGTVVFIGSRSAWRSNNPMTGGYCASKAAINAAADSLSAELGPFNIRVLNVLPGGMRTNNWVNVLRSTSAGPDRSIADYDAVRARMTGWAAAQTGHEMGDPAKAASVIVDVVRGEGAVLFQQNSADEGGPGVKEAKWPTPLALGEDAEQDIRDRCTQMLQALDEWKEISRSIAF